MNDYSKMTLEQAKARIKAIKKWQQETGKLWDSNPKPGSEPKVEPFELERIQEQFNLTNSQVNEIVGSNVLGHERQLGDWHKMQELMKKENLTEEEVERLSSEEINRRLGKDSGFSEGQKLR
jgi:hypothetical protein